MPVQMQMEKTKYKNSIVPAIKTMYGNIGATQSDVFEFMIIVRGSGACSIDGDYCELRSGDLYFLSPGSLYMTSFETEATIISIKFSPEICSEKYALEILENKSYALIKLKEEDVLFIKHLTEEMKRAINSDVPNAHYVTNLLDCIISKIYMMKIRAEDIENTLIRRSIVYMQNNFKRRLTLQEVSDIAGYTPNYFSKRFRHQTGVTFKSYLNNLRFSYAEYLLKQTNLSVTEVCFESGFNDYSHFLYAFKNKYDISPAKFRKTVREKES